MKQQEHNNKTRCSVAALMGLAALIVFLVLMMGPAQAAPSPAASVIYVDIDAAGADNGSSWTDAYPNLQDALAAWTAGSEIWAAEGRYFPDVGGGRTAGDREASFVLTGDLQLYGGFDGTEAARDDRDPAAHVTVLSGDIDKNDNVDADGVTLAYSAIRGANSHNVVSIKGAGNTVLLDGLVVSGGDATKTASNEQGAGIHISGVPDAHPVIRNLRIQGNRAFELGGGLSTYETPLTLSDTIFKGNAVQDDSLGDLHLTKGGGMYVGGAADTHAPVQLQRVLFENNLAEEGGGLNSEGFRSTGLTLDDVHFSANTAIWSGGGMYNGGAHAVLTNVEFVANRVETDDVDWSIAPDHGGGGLYLGGEFSRPKLTNVIFIANESRTTRADCPDDNHRLHGYGGGLHVYLAVPSLTNVLFSGNRADGYGGAIFMSRQGGSGEILEMNNVTIVGNFSQNCVKGHAIYYSDVNPVRFSNSIIWNNGAGGIDAIWAGSPGSLDFRNSVVQGCDYSGTFDPFMCGTDSGGNLNVDPKLVDQTPYTRLPALSGNNRLTIGSPAVDKGDNNFLPAGVTSDLDLRHRIVDGDGDSTATVDMGAYELPFTCPPTGSNVLRVDKDATAGTSTGLNWTDALLTVQDALLLYEKCPASDIDEVWVAEGVYYPDVGGYFGNAANTPLDERRQRSFHMTNDGTGGIHLYGGFDGTEASLGDRGDPEVHVTVLSGDMEHNDDTDANGVVLDPSGIVGTNSNHVLYEDTANCDATTGVDCPSVDGFTVTGGYARGLSGLGTTAEEQGGGMYSNIGVTNLAKVRFQGNVAILGGGLHMDGRSENILDQVRFENNWALKGGGLSAVLESRPELGIVTFQGNRAIAFSDSQLLLANGGGMYIASTNHDATKLENVEFLDNVADNNGGGLYSERYEPAFDTLLTLHEVRFLRNEARSISRGEGFGGGMANRATSPDVDRAWFQGNIADSGGAVANLEGANPTFFNTLISGNVGQNTGGGMYNDDSSPELTNVTFSGNKVQAAIRNVHNSDPLIRNTVIWDNGGLSIQNGDDADPVISNSLIEGCVTEGGWHSLCGTDGGGNIEPEYPWSSIFEHPINPSTAPSIDGDFHLARTSPAIDQGNNAYNNSTYDLDGPAHPRRLDGNGDGTVTIDMGPYETTTAGRIKVVKETVPAGSNKLFVYELTLPDPQADRVYFALGDGETWDSSNLPPSTYVLVEARYPDWDRVSASCDDGNSNLPSIVLEGGETVTCTFRNVQRGKIIVDKVSHPSDSQKFPFVLSGGPDNVNQNFALADGDTPHDSGYVKAGSYSVVEGNVSGWELSSAVCSDGSDPANIDLDYGETVRCTFNNLEPDSIVIHKEVEPGTGSGFKFTDNIAAPNHSFTLDDGQSEAFHDVKPGTYTITEEDPTSGYHMADIICGGSFKSKVIDLDQRTVTLTMEQGQTAHCTFRNKGLHMIYMPIVASAK